MDPSGGLGINITLTRIHVMSLPYTIISLLVLSNHIPAGPGIFKAMDLKPIRFDPGWRDQHRYMPDMQCQKLLELSASNIPLPLRRSPATPHSTPEHVTVLCWGELCTRLGEGS